MPEIWNIKVISLLQKLYSRLPLHLKPSAVFHSDDEVSAILFVASCAFEFEERNVIVIKMRYTIQNCSEKNGLWFLNDVV